MLCGVGILSTPYAIREGGWLGLGILMLFACLSYYTGILLRDCLDSQPGLETYPDIGQAAFGVGGRICISVSLVNPIPNLTLLLLKRTSVLSFYSIEDGAVGDNRCSYVG